MRVSNLGLVVLVACSSAKNAMYTSMAPGAAPMADVAPPAHVATGSPLVQRLCAAGVTTDAIPGGFAAMDPWGTRIRFTIAP